MMRVKIRMGLVVLAMGAVFVACQLQSVPLSAQAGSTVAIALDTGETLGRIGYGGDYSSDPQRGRILLKLLQPDTLICSEDPCRYLYARMASVGVGPESTDVARVGPPVVLGVQPQGARMAVVLFDIPAATLPGTWDLKAYREVTNTDPNGDPSLVALSNNPEERTLSILPNGLEPSGVPGEWQECGPETNPVVTCGADAVVGTTTPADYWRQWSGKSGTGWLWTNGQSYADYAFPSPELIFNVSGGNVWALEFTVPYDRMQFEVLDVVAPIDTTVPANDRPAVFFEDDGLEIKVRVVGLFQKITRVALVFDLEVNSSANPSFTRLDWTDYSTGGSRAPQNVIAYDDNGLAISATVSAIGVL